MCVACFASVKSGSVGYRNEQVRGPGAPWPFGHPDDGIRIEMQAFLNWSLPALAIIAFVLAYFFGAGVKRWLINRFGEADAIREADVFLAYGRRQQAIEQLEAGLKHHPERQDIAAKLARLRAE